MKELDKEIMTYLLALVDSVAVHAISPREAVIRAFEAGRDRGRLNGQLEGFDRGVKIAREVILENSK